MPTPALNNTLAKPLFIISQTFLTFNKKLKCLFGCRHQDEQTPLHISSRLGKQDIVHQLLANGACPDATTNSGYTPLHLAAREGHKDVASGLLDQGASLGIITKVNLMCGDRYFQDIGCFAIWRLMIAHVS